MFLKSHSNLFLQHLPQFKVLLVYLSIYVYTYTHTFFIQILFLNLNHFRLLTSLRHLLNITQHFKKVSPYFLTFCI